MCQKTTPITSQKIRDLPEYQSYEINLSNFVSQICLTRNQTWAHSANRGRQITCD